MLWLVVGLGIENARAILPFTLGHLFRVREPDFRVPPPTEIRSDYSILSRAQAGPILEISFAGRYPPGSLGNEHAAYMLEIAERTIRENRPAAVLFNLKSLNYVWGDAIDALAHTLYDRDTQAFLPGCVFATGRTATALSGLFTPGWLFTRAEMKLFRSHEDSVAYLVQRLKSQSVESE